VDGSFAREDCCISAQVP